MSIKIKGVVREGSKVGRKIGFPTANIPLDDIIGIDTGVYVVEFIVDGYTYKGVANMGMQPTMKNLEKPLLEVNIFDYNGDLYGKQVEVTLLKRIREEIKFARRDELIEAIKNDAQTARNYFASL